MVRHFCSARDDPVHQRERDCPPHARRNELEEHDRGAVTAEAVYAADGGIDTGIQTLKSDQADGTTNFCPLVGTSFAAVSATTINSKPVTISCKTTSGGSTTTSTTDDGGGSALRTGYTMILGTGGLSFTGNTSNRVPSSLVRGDVYSAGPLSVPDPQLALTINGDLEYARPARPRERDGDLPGVCSKRTTAPAPAGLPPTVVLPTNTAQTSVTYGSNCTILFPGMYTAANLPAFADGAQYYMASGTYYVVGTGDINLKGTVFGGAPGAESKTVTGSTPSRPTPSPKTR